jgi:sugar lactone lactonase YvrE
VKITKIALNTLVGATVLVGISPLASAQPQADYGPPLETVKTCDTFKLVGIGVSHEGRIFASAPAAQSGDRLVEVNAQTGAVTPYPDQTWNTSGPDTEHEWAVPQAMWVDKADHLWVLDSGRAVLTGAGPSAKPKLVEFDLAGNKVMRSYRFDGTVAATDSLNDLRIDLVHGYAYLTNIGNRGSLVVLDLETGKSRQVLVGDRSTFADPQPHLMIGDQPAESANGKPVAIHADGIAFSPDAKWVYYRPLTDHKYWRVPTSALIDARLTPDELSREVQYLGSAELAGGLIMDQHGTLYGGDLEHSCSATTKLKLCALIFLAFFPQSRPAFATTRHINWNCRTSTPHKLKLSLPAGASERPRRRLARATTVGFPASPLLTSFSISTASWIEAMSRSTSGEKSGHGGGLAILAAAVSRKEHVREEFLRAITLRKPDIAARNLCPGVNIHPASPLSEAGLRQRAQPRGPPLRLAMRKHPKSHPNRSA